MVAAVVVLTLIGRVSADIKVELDIHKDKDSNKCGDGFKKLFEECDDGNNIDGDG